MLYRALLAALIRLRLDPERAHGLAAAALGALGRLPPTRRALGALLAPRDPALVVEALGLRFPSPLGVAAGVDKDGRWFGGLTALGFGFVEVGTLTAQGQPGNPRPRIARLPRERALLNSMGFPNRGAEAAARLLRERPPGVVLGANVGKTRAVPIKDAAADYRAAVRSLAPACDYLALNVSSPNTPGLAGMQAAAPLRELVRGVRAELTAGGLKVPLLVKLGPDLDDEELDAVGDLALELELDGIVAVNTTRRHEAVGAALAAPPGGLSGAPLAPRAVHVLERLCARTRGRTILISVGGIQSAEDVWARIRAGATLVQAYTGFVYGGPLWPRRVNRGLARLAHEDGFASVGEAVGSAGPTRGPSAATPAG